MPVEEIRQYTEAQMRQYLARAKRPEKRQKWRALIQEAKEEKAKATIKRTTRAPTRGKILQYFKPKTTTEESATFQQIKMDPRKMRERMLKKALKPRAPRARIGKQEQKYKHLLEFEATIWGESENQTIRIAEINENNKTIMDLIAGFESYGMKEGNLLDPTTFNQEIIPGLGADGVWLGKKRAYTIKAISVKTRIVKG